MESLAELVEQFGEKLVTRWAISGKRAYDKRRADKARITKVRAANEKLAKMSKDEFREFIHKLKSKK